TPRREWASWETATPRTRTAPRERHSPPGGSPPPPAVLEGLVPDSRSQPSLNHARSGQPVVQGLSIDEDHHEAEAKGGEGHAEPGESDQRLTQTEGLGGVLHDHGEAEQLL